MDLFEHVLLDYEDGLCGGCSGEELDVGIGLKGH
jgi:hypothetical protein